MQNNKRLSNIELLRIVSMFLVMLFHVTDAIPHKNLITENSLDGILLNAFSSLSIICVDVFILISGNQKYHLSILNDDRAYPKEMEEVVWR